MSFYLLSVFCPSSNAGDPKDANKTGLLEAMAAPQLRHQLDAPRRLFLLGRRRGLRPSSATPLPL